MTRVADDKKVTDRVLARHTVQQWELFRRVKEGTLNAEIVHQGLKMLTFNEQVIGFRSHADHGGVEFTVDQKCLSVLAKLVKADGKKVQTVSFTPDQIARAREEGRDLLAENNWRLATLGEALGYVAGQKRALGAKRLGATQLKIDQKDFPWTIGFQQWETEITIFIAQLNFDYISGWREKLTLLVVPL